MTSTTRYSSIERRNKFIEEIEHQLPHMTDENKIKKAKADINKKLETIEKVKKFPPLNLWLGLKDRCFHLEVSESYYVRNDVKGYNLNPSALVEEKEEHFFEFFDQMQPAVVPIFPPVATQPVVVVPQPAATAVTVQPVLTTLQETRNTKDVKQNNPDIVLIKPAVNSLDKVITTVSDLLKTKLNGISLSTNIVIAEFAKLNTMIPEKGSLGISFYKSNPTNNFAELKRNLLNQSKLFGGNSVCIILDDCRNVTDAALVIFEEKNKNEPTKFEKSVIVVPCSFSYKQGPMIEDGLDELLEAITKVYQKYIGK